MRLALVIASDYQQSPLAPNLTRSPEDADRFASFLDQSEADLAIEELTADRGFAEQLEQALNEQPRRLASLVLYFSGCVVTAPGREPSLLLDGERLGAFALPRLGRLLEERTSRALVVIDAVSVAHDGAGPEQVVDAVGRALVRHGAVSVLASIRPPEQATQHRTSFTDLLLFSWESALGSDASDLELGVSDVFDSMRGEAAFEDLPAARYFPGRADFNLLAESGSESEQEVSGLRLASDGPPAPVFAGNGKPPPPTSALGRPAAPSVPPPPPTNALGRPAASSVPPPPPLPLPKVPAPVLPSAHPRSGAASARPTHRTGSPSEAVLGAPPLLPTLPSPGVAAPPSGVHGEAASDSAGLSRLMLPAGMAAPRISRPARSDAIDALRAFDALQSSDPEIEEEVTEPGQPFASIADETTVDSALDGTPDTERKAPAAVEAGVSSSSTPPRNEGEVLAADDGGFADGEDTEVTEGFGLLSDSILRAEASSSAPPNPLALRGELGTGGLDQLTPETLPTADDPQTRSGPPAAEGGAFIAALLEQSLASESLTSLSKPSGPSIAALVQESLLGESVPAPDADHEVSINENGLPAGDEPTPSRGELASGAESEPESGELPSRASERDSLAELVPESEQLPAYASERDSLDSEVEGPVPEADPLPSFASDSGRMPAFASESGADDALPSFARDDEPSVPDHPPPADGVSLALPPTFDAASAGYDSPLPSFESEAMDEAAVAPLPYAVPPLRSPLPPPPQLPPGATPAVAGPRQSNPSEGEAQAEHSERQLSQVEGPAPDGPLEPYEVCLTNGDALLSEREFAQAVAEYEKALTHAPADQAGVVYGRLGAVCRARGDYDGAITNFEIALELLPGDRAPLTALTELCMMQREFHAVEGYQRRFLEVQQEPDARSDVWNGMAALWRDHASDTERYRAILQEWSRDVPQALEPHRLLVSDYEQHRQHELAIEARRQLAALLADPALASAELVAAVRGICTHLSDADYAVSIALQALQLHPSALSAFELATELLVQQERWEELARIYEQALAAVNDAFVQLEVRAKLGALYRDRLGSPERTITAYERVLEEDSSRIDLRRQLVDLYTVRGEHQLALLHCRRALRAEPNDHDLYRKIYGLLDKVGEADAAWNAAMVLDWLGEADINEQLVADAHRPSGLLAAKGTVPEDCWGHGLFTPERDGELAEVLAALFEPAVELRASFLRKRKRVPKLEADKRHDPNTSTTTLAKSLLWTSKLLSVKPPELYVLEEVAGDLAAASVDSPTAMASKSLARGMSLAQLAFLWGRHLTLFRPEHYLAVFYPSVEELEHLLLAALTAGECPNLSLTTVSPEAKKLAKELKKKLHPGSYERLRAASRSFRTDRMPERAAHWLKTVELAGGRAGLLACGDVAVAADLVRKHPLSGLTLGQDQVADIMCFSVSAEYATLRGRLGVAIA